MPNPITRWGNVGGVSSNASTQATALMNNALAKLTDPLQKYENKKVAYAQEAYKKERADNTAKMLLAYKTGDNYIPPNDNYDKMEILNGRMKIDTFNQQQKMTGLNIDKLEAGSSYWDANAKNNASMITDQASISSINAKNAPEKARLGLSILRTQKKVGDKQLGYMDADRQLQNNLTQSQINKNNRIPKTGGSGKRSGSGLTDTDVARLAAFNTELGSVSYDRPMTEKEAINAVKSSPILAELVDNEKQKIQDKINRYKKGNTPIPFNDSMRNYEIKKLTKKMNNLTLENSGVMKTPRYQQVVKDYQTYRTVKDKRKLKPSEVLDQTMGMVDAEGMTGRKAVVLGYLAQQSAGKKVVKQKKNADITKNLYKMSAAAKEAQDTKDEIRLRASLKPKK